MGIPVIKNSLQKGIILYEQGMVLDKHCFMLYYESFWNRQ